MLDWHGLFTPRGRPPTARERLEAKPPHQDPRNALRMWGPPAPIVNDSLDEQAALEAAYREQRREPVDLIGRAA